LSSSSCNTKISNIRKGVTTTVAFVCCKNAKQLKTALEAAGYLDKKYRMIRTMKEEDGQIDTVAVPIISECMKAIKDPIQMKELSWVHLISGFGTHYVPYSPSLLGQQKK
jgi:hypothetical protein